MNWKECGRKWLWSNLKCCFSIPGKTEEKQKSSTRIAAYGPRFESETS
jgi:hypothetical protein